MLLRNLLPCVAAVAAATLNAGTPSASFIAAEKARALQGILANIGANGSLAHGADSGIVIAAPSTVSTLGRACQSI